MKKQSRAHFLRFVETKRAAVTRFISRFKYHNCENVVLHAYLKWGRRYVKRVAKSLMRDRRYREIIRASAEEFFEGGQPCACIVQTILEGPRERYP